MGYPVTEPYWTTIRVGGASRQVLVQAFQRRVLTYSPTNPAGWQVEMGNVAAIIIAGATSGPPATACRYVASARCGRGNPGLANALGCPQPWTKEQSVPTAVQHFEHGLMFYVGQTYSYPFGNPSIFVLLMTAPISTSTTPM